MTDYLFSSKPMYLWLALALPVCSSLFLISKINDFALHFDIQSDLPADSIVMSIDPDGL